MTYEECVDYLLNIPRFKDKPGNDNLDRILEIMGHPERECPVIHVAGTNGKGSFCAFLNEMLKGAGFKVGLFTSPHLVKINERIKINSCDISDSDFLDSFNHVLDVVKRSENEGVCHPSFFEFIFLIAVNFFSAKELDFVILETGLGGRLDATNTVLPVLSVITSINFDHVQYLGDTIEKIAYEKAGIIKPEIPVLYFKRDEISATVIEDKAEEISSSVFCVQKKDLKIDKITKKYIDFSYRNDYHNYVGLRISTVAVYQTENAALAVEAFEILYKQGMLNDIDFNSYLDIVRTSLDKMVWKGRMQQITDNIYVDGAHNVEAVEAFCRTLETSFKDVKKVLMFAVSADKDYTGMVKRLCEVPFEEIVICRYDGNRSADTNNILEVFSEFFGGRITTFDDYKEGFLYCKNHVDDEFVFCMGSLYLVGDLLGFWESMS